jgi:hypothetical protein
VADQPPGLLRPTELGGHFPVLPLNVPREHRAGERFRGFDLAPGNISLQPRDKAQGLLTG